jgi:hypothetical protein
VRRNPGGCAVATVLPCAVFCPENKAAVTFLSRKSGYECAQADRSMRMTSRPGIERGFERILFASRWLMAPMYLGLVAGLGMLVFIFLRDLGYYLPKLLAMKSDDAILVALTLIDLTLAANLVLIVMFSGYENFVSKFDFDAGEERLNWMGKVD